MPVRRTDDDFSAEVQAHLEHEIDRLVSEGLTREAARAEAIRAFGSPTRIREDFHTRSRWTWLEQCGQDLRYAARGLRASPAFLAMTVVTLAIGIGLLTTAFTVFNAYLLRPLAVQEPERLYRLAWRAPNTVGDSFSWHAQRELRDRTDLFDGVIGDDMRFVPAEGRMLVVSAVSDNYFSVLRPRMLLGRALDAGDTGGPAAVIGQQAWARLFASDRDVLGRSIALDTRMVTVVGVVREEFVGLDGFPRDLWVPADPAGGRSAKAVVRLRDGVSPAQAEAGLQAFVSSMGLAGTPPQDVRAVLVSNSTPNPLTFELLALLSPVFAAFALVLLTACFNVSNVTLARAIARHREIALRLSLGASRARVVRQLLTEGLVIVGLAAACALALAAALLRGGVVLLFDTLPPVLASLLRIVPLRLDVRVFLFALATAAGAALAFALLPAVQASRQPLSDALRGHRGRQASGSRSRNVLVVAQVVVSIVLVVTALVLTRNFTALTALDLGYATRNVYSITLRGNHETLVRRAAEALSADPRVGVIAATSGNPLLMTRTAPAAPQGGRAAAPVKFTFVSPEYFPMLRLPITRGRGFLASEAGTSARVAIVSEAMAREFWPGGDPLGQVVMFDRSVDTLTGYSQVTVIGTVPDAVSGLMFEGVDRGHIYLPTVVTDPHATALLVQPRSPAGFRPEMLREAFRGPGFDPDLFEVIGLEEMRLTQLYPVRAASLVGAVLAVIALLLSISGLYGVLSYTLAQRTREIGIRMALGAKSRAVVDLVVRQSLRLAGAGALIGLGLAAAVMKALSSAVRFDAVSLLHIGPFIGGAAVVLAATALAAWQPARRATRVDPAETLRADA